MLISRMNDGIPGLPFQNAPEVARLLEV